MYLSSFLQEFMAALYVFTMFRTESKNVLDSGLVHVPKIFTSKVQSKSAAGLVQSAVERTLNSPLGQYDMFLRFLCGLLSPDGHDGVLRGRVYSRHAPKLQGLDKVRQVLEKTLRSAPEDRVHNFQECLRELTQKDE